MTKRAVVLFNLGGPDGPDAVQPFLFNLFNDPAIIGAPGPIRWALAKFISSRRAPVAREIYAHLGGGSPLLSHTRDQAEGLAARLQEDGIETRVFVAMRYWHPMIDATVAEVKAWAPDQVVLLPLYPQFSTTTTGSSLTAWRAEAARQGLAVPTAAVCCYPVEPGFVAAQAELIAETLSQLPPDRPYRLLFSAHGLPERIVAKGDPYVDHVRQTAAATIDHLAVLNHAVSDWQVSFQSRVGRLKWVEPYTEDEIERAGADGCGLVVVPIAFVSEHSETLVELDIEYRELAAAKGVPDYRRVSTVLSAPAFLDGLAAMIRGVDTTPVCRGDGKAACPGRFPACPLRSL